MTRQSIFNSWTTRLAEAIATAVRELAPRVTDESIAVLAVDGHPWHGAIYLAMLTGGELAEDEQLAQPSEMAAWRYYDFAGQLKAKRLFVPLGDAMQRAYEQSDDKPAIVESFLTACAIAVKSPNVRAALKLLNQAKGFRLSVAHPDNNKEYVVGQ